MAKEEEVAGIKMSLVKMADLKTAVKALNASDLLEEKIKVSGRRSKALAVSFCKGIESLMGEYLDEIPAGSWEYYEKIVVTEEAETDPDPVEDAGETEDTAVPADEPGTEEQTEEVTDPPAEEEEEKTEEVEETEKEDNKKATKKTEKKKTEKKKTEKKQTTKKAGAKKKAGVIASIMEFMTKPSTKNQILAKLKTRFPERDVEKMEKTFNCQVGGKNRPFRMEKEKGISIVIDGNKFSIAEKKKK